MGTTLPTYSEIEFPSRLISKHAEGPLCLLGWAVRANGEVPSHFVLKFGKRSLSFDPVRRFDPLALPAEVTPDNAQFGLEAVFRTRPGWKLVTVEAHWKDGTHSILTRRLIHAGPRGVEDPDNTTFPAHFERVWQLHQKLYHPLTVAEQESLARIPCPKVTFFLLLRRGTSSELATRTIESLQAQTWGDDWKLLIVAPAQDDDLQQMAGRLAAPDNRIDAVTAPDAHLWNHIRTILEERTGEGWAAVLHPGDRLAPESIARVALHLDSLAGNSPDVLYSDECTRKRKDHRSQPILKPTHSPHLLEETDFWGDLCLIQRETILKTEGWQESFRSATRWEFHLRLQSMDCQVSHIPHVLYERLPVNEGGFDAIVSSTDGVEMLRDHLRSDQTDQQPRFSGLPGRFHIRAPEALSGKVSIIIPFRDRPELLQVAVESILRLTRYPFYEIILVDNDSSEPDTVRLLERWSRDPRIRVTPCRREFNFAALINQGAAHSDGTYLLLLNNDTQVISPDWLDVMVGYARRPEVGAVGANLFFGDGTIQHTGAALGLTGLAGHIYSGLNCEEVPNRWADLTRDVSVVTAACLLVRREVFTEVGGFNEEFTVCGNDVDFCLKLHEKGYFNVVPAMARLFHYESKSRDPGKIPANDFKVSLKRYLPYLRNGDPFWHPALSMFEVTGLPRLSDELPLQWEHLRAIPGGESLTLQDLQTEGQP